MRDIAVLMMLFGGIALAFRAPWLGVLALAVFGYLNPHRYAWGFSTTLPVYTALFLAVGLSFIFNKEDSQRVPRDWRIPVFYLFWAYLVVTTIDAIAPTVAWPKLIETSKIYLPLFFTLVLINSREKLRYLIITIAV